MKNYYAKLSAEEKQRRIQNASNSRKKRKYAHETNNSDNNSNEKRKTDSLPKAHLDSYEHEANICLHELKRQQPCEYCGAKKFEYEAPMFCCRNGQIKLATTNIPHDLVELFTSQTSEAKEFRDKIRAYNSLFAFTSFGAKLDQELASSRKGVYAFRAQGQIYHNIPSLIPRNDNPCYFQLYFYDTENELQNRLTKMPDLNAMTVEKLMDILKDNPYARFLRRLNEYSSLEELKIHIVANVKLDQRIYNSPSASQVAAIWVEGNNPNVPFEREIVIHTHSGDQQRVKHYYGCYDPLQYPLFFPNGESGWHQRIKKQDRRNETNEVEVEESNLNVHTFTSIHDILRNEQEGVERDNPKYISCREYYCYKLQIRPQEQSLLHLGGRLMQQFVVDMYIKLETTRLDYFRNQQSLIRAELYQGIVDSVNAGESRGNRVGKWIVLPGSFVGGPRDMRRRYLDAMTLVQRFGKPDLFITMTSNPDWNEVKEELPLNVSAPSRPDLPVRIFRAKLQDLRDQLYKKEIFGKVAAHVEVVEFQKRGLPHIHMLIILKPGYKITDPDQFDKFVCAEIPDEKENPVLYRLVAKHMMHGPCGVDNPNNSCMVNSKCRFHYPRSFCSRTTLGKDGYPTYRRRKDPTLQVKARKAILDNKWVAPYNPYLLLRYNCHVNVEICSGMRAVKYLYKYIYKGHDKIAVCIDEDDGLKNVDEIQRFQDARWVSAPEAIWRILGFELNDISPAVINLQLHLPDQQYVTYWANQDLEHVIQCEHISRTMLTEFFRMCSTDEFAKTLLYRDFPEHYVWSKKAKVWTKRRQREVIGRLNVANPKEGERYYLRILLNHVRGPESFQDLLTVNGTQCKTFKESAMRRGLLESDQSISECLDEAVTFQMPQALRRLFATIIVFCKPTNVRKLWNDYSEALSEDFKRIHEHLVETQISCTLESIKYFLESMGKDITSYDLPRIETHSSDFTFTKIREIAEEMAIKTPQEDFDAVTKLNLEQETAYKVIIERVDLKQSGVFFVDGPGGTGKTFLYRALLANVRSKGMIALATATSGVAAAILPGGRTAHSRFGLPLFPTETSVSELKKQSGAAELLRKATLIIWDEAPMAKRQLIETLDRSLRDFTNCSEVFGGKVIVFGGDFRQVLPVVPRGTINETINTSLVKSYLWNNMQVLKLKTNMRAISDKNFGDFLLRIGNGDEPTIGDNLILLPDEMIVKHGREESCETALIDAVFPSLAENSNSAEYITNRAILATTNENVDKLNDKIIEIFPGEKKEFNSFDQASDDTNNHYGEEFLNSLLPNGFPPHKLILKINCPIILLRNLDPSNGLCNGTRMVCRGFSNNVIHAEIAVGLHTGKQVLLPRIPLYPPDDEGYPFKFIRKQFPVRLCFAMTINKAQGQTIQNVGVYLLQHVFSHGQLYVALSRGISMSTTKVLVKSDDEEGRKETYTKNIVYKGVLQTGS